PTDKVPEDDKNTEDDTQKEDTNKNEGTSTPQRPYVPPIYDENVFNVLLIGTDSRDNNSRGRSDSMILVSINKKTEEIHMTSFMRDSYVAIPGKYNNRINAAYAYGGADLLMDTIELNFKVKVDKYVRVNFFSFMEVIDAVGGVTITVSDAEVKVMNNYISEINGILGKNRDDGKLSKGGTYNLTGKQALGYCRIRYVGNADFQRTQRQRDVLMKVIEKAKGMSIAEINNFLEVLLPKVTTNIPEDEIFSLVLNALSYVKYPVYQHRIPADGSWWNLRVRGMAVLGMNFDTNINMIREEIYGK
ncbi:MAG: LCP family protein, partial [Oscillospiraceae bacterium]|nr:LCP family protein [Oscillospiraceae bacterium]